MAQNGTASYYKGSWVRLNPWNVLAASLALAVLAVISRFSASDAVLPVRGLLIFGSMLFAVAGISLRLQGASWHFEERIRSSGVVVSASLIALINYVAMDNWIWSSVFTRVGLENLAAYTNISPDWDSIRLFVRVAVVVGFVASAVILLTKVLQRVVISLLLIFHFIGILAAVTSVPHPSAPSGPWISMQLWSRVYRPYLFFTYLINAYHFYSPDPGPATLLWFYVKFDDGTGEWYKLAEKKDFGTRQEYQRMLAITESTNQTLTQTPPDNIWEAKVLARRTAANFLGIPISPLYQLTVQYREPNLYSRNMTASYAQYVANHYHSSKNPDLKVKSVKVYRVIHMIVNADSLADGVDPSDPTQYMPYYHGEFDSEGRLLDPQSPFLYWLLPTEAKPKHDLPAKYQNTGKRPPAKYLEYIPYHERHAETTGPDPEKK